MDEKILGLQVPIDYPSTVHVLQPGQHLVHTCPHMEHRWKIIYKRNIFKASMMNTSAAMKRADAWSNEPS